MIRPSNNLARSESLQLVEHSPPGAFSTASAFEDAQRMAKLLASSALIPDTFRGKIADCVIALELAGRIGASPLAVMQNLYLVHGKPAWSSQFLIACVNACGRFTPLRYVMAGTGDDYGCTAWAKDKQDERLESPKVTIRMAKEEGWFGKNGSKWKTMPELMLRYRAATLFTRLYAPELTMGIRCEEEIIDISPVVTETPMPKFGTKPEEPAQSPTPPPEPTLQGSFGEYMTAAGVAFADFKGWLLTTGRVKEAPSWSDWEAMPEALVNSVQADLSGLSKCITLYGKPEVMP